LTFSEAMNTAIEPTVTFDLTAPYTKNVVVADPGWVNATTWQGSFAIDIDTGDGTHTIKVLGARSADGFVIPDDTLHRFVVDTSGATVANLGLATISGVSQVVISWDNDSGGVVTPAGYNVLRSTTGAAGSYRQINTGLIAVSDGPKTSYIDSTTIAGTQYYWLVYRVDTNGNSEIWSGPMTNSEAEVDVRYGSTQVPNGGGPVELGSVAMGGTALTRTFTVYNYGYGTLSASNLSVSSPYAISEGLAATIPSGGSDTFTISLPTGTAGTFNATVSFTTNDANQPTCNFTITGRVEAVDADLIWVKFDYSGSEQGTQTFPYNTLGEGIGAVNSGGTVRIYSGSVGGAYRITRQTRLEAYGGSVRIGLATGLGEPSAGLDGANSHDSGQSRRNTTSGRSAATDWMLYR
ncbi:MAG: choice-of-anchor D domain-containing protein, partial [Rhodocyclaceae bacterium]|nr:choice-of-anchor D domain-containing protein [Rhodocyclaceae bacterium]